MADFRTLEELNIGEVFNYRGAYQRLVSNSGLSAEDCEALVADTLVDCWLVWDRATYSVDQFCAYANAKIFGEVFRVHKHSRYTGSVMDPVKLDAIVSDEKVASLSSDSFETTIFSFFREVLLEGEQSPKQRQRAELAYQMLLLRYRDGLGWGEVAKRLNFASKQAAQRRFSTLKSTLQKRLRSQVDRVYERFGIVLGERVLEAVGA